MCEIEKQFFDTFGIEPEYKICPFHHCIYKKEYDCDNCDDREWHYPQITDRILLELICIAYTSPVITFTSRNIEALKEEVLLVLCNWVNHEDIKQQVQALFK